MSSQPQYTAIGDEPIEARIVAWVLGDASAFEAAELERLCGERPELLVFRRRMRALHGLLTEAAVPDHSTKLPPAKRKALDAIFGVDKPPGLVKTPRAVRRHWRQRILAIAACLALMAGAIALFAPASMRLSKSGPVVAERVPLTIAYPPELLEGTPGPPIVLNRPVTPAAPAAAAPPPATQPAEPNVALLRDQAKPAADSGALQAASDLAANAKQAAEEDDRSKLALLDHEDRDAGAMEPQTALGGGQRNTSDRARLLVPQSKAKRVVSEGAGSSYAVPESGDRFAKMPPLASTDSLASSGSGHGFGEGPAVLPPAAKVGAGFGRGSGAASGAGSGNGQLSALQPQSSVGGVGGGAALDGDVAATGPADGPVAGEPTGAATRESAAPPAAVASAAMPALTKNAKALRQDLAGSHAETTKLARDDHRVAGFKSDLQPDDAYADRDEGAKLAILGSVTKELQQAQDGTKYAADAQTNRWQAGARMAGGKPQVPAKPSSDAAARMTPPSGAVAAAPDADRGRALDPAAVALLPTQGQRQADSAPAAIAAKDALRWDDELTAAAAEPASGSAGRSDESQPNGDKSDLAGFASHGTPLNSPQDQNGRKLAEVIRSGDALATGNSFDAIPNAPGRSKTASGADSSAAVPALGELPAVGRLLADKKDAAANSSDDVRRGLYTAEGNFNLGKFDDAKREYEKVLRNDPDNQAAHRGIAGVDSAMATHERAAIDQSRAELPAQVDKSGETALSAGTLEVNEDGLAKPPAAGEDSERLLGLVQREKTRCQSAEVDSDRYLVEARDASTKGNYQDAYDNYVKALHLLPEVPATTDRRDFLRKSLGDVALALASEAIKDGNNDQAKDWLAKAVEWDPHNEPARRQVVADVAAEIPAAEAPYSTFSLSISDASFKMAQAALARGERPDPASIKIEQFYNAVDYGDPAPGPGEAVAGWVEQAAHPLIPGRNLVRVALRTGAAGRSAAQPLRLTLLVDQSGSMARDDRRAAMAIALKQLAGLLTKNDLVTVIGFSRSPRLLADALTGDQGAILNEVVNQAASEGGTNLEEAMKLGEQMALRHLTAGAQNRIVLFTDGAANLGDADPSRLADKVTAMRQKGLAFDIAGIGTTNLNDQLLAELARHGNGRYCVVGADKDAGDSFARQLAGAFRPAAENVKVQVRFNPQRVGRYKLLGFEEHRLKTEDFHNDAVDAAELAAEEAGVALYQVEPLAEGSGELGEVSVRFRDAASGQMVERSWTIPYDAAAPAFDRATPSMQLAGLALLAAEKLRGGPLAEAIDFKQLSAPRATVKQFYSNSRRVAEMLEVVTKL